MLIYEDDRTYQFDFTFEESELAQNISIKEMGVFQFQNIYKYGDDGFPQPLYYNDTTKKYVNMTYVQKRSDWMETDITKVFKYEYYQAQ